MVSGLRGNGDGLEGCRRGLLVAEPGAGDNEVEHLDDLGADAPGKLALAPAVSACSMASTRVLHATVTPWRSSSA